MGLIVDKATWGEPEARQPEATGGNWIQLEAKYL